MPGVSRFLEYIPTLSLGDKVALVFLLSQVPKDDLFLMEAMRKADNKTEADGLFRQFLIKLSLSETDLSDQLIEGFSVIQNFRIGRCLGILRDEMLQRRSAHKISLVRKHLYSLADNMTEQQKINLMSQVEGDTNEKDDCFLEEILLRWQWKQIINIGPDWDSSCLDSIEKFAPPIWNETAESRAPAADECESYQIFDSTEMGYCIVINNSDFSTNNNFKHLMPLNPLPSRPGSEKDVASLTETFTRLSFRVECFENVKLDEMQILLPSYAKSIPSNHSLFALVFMSHGTEGVVYTADSVPVSVEALEMAFQRDNCPVLTGKPKIFIIQACQGLDLQRVMIDSPVAVPHANLDNVRLGPEKGDSVIAWSTVKGYASFRDMFEGAWFIQELCKELSVSSNDRDFVEIITKVNNNLRYKSYCGLSMVPSLTSSLCKKINLNYKS